jgi:signal transduction histidine kinase
MNITPKISLQQKLQDKEYFLKETALMTQTGSYSCNLKTGSCFIDEIGKNILKLPDYFVLNFKSALTLFVDYQEAIDRFKRCIDGANFEQDLEMIDFKGYKLWVRATAKILYDENTKEVVGIRGVFVSIDRFIKQGKELEKKAQVIEVQNNRLIHFAHIISHNLRSHSSNLELTLETFADRTSKSEEKVFKSYLHDISSSLSQTLEHLNEVVTINTQERSREYLEINEVFESVLKEYEPLLKHINAQIVYDFSGLTHINYVPSFLQSIITNLLSNTIKYRDSSRPLKVKIKSKRKKNKNILIFKDNGLGIDLTRNKDKIFNMYRTFHGNDDALGVGLFITKNQVESLGGDISVKSTLGKGSTFTVKF